MNSDFYVCECNVNDLCLKLPPSLHCNKDNKKIENFFPYLHMISSGFAYRLVILCLQYSMVT